MFYLQSSPGISPCKPISHLSFQSVKVVWPKHLGFPNKSLPLLKFALNGTWRCTIPGFQSLVTRDFLFLGRWPPPPEQLELLLQCWPGWSILRALSPLWWVMFYVQEKLGHDALSELTCRNTNHRHFQIHDIRPPHGLHACCVRNSCQNLWNFICPEGGGSFSTSIKSQHSSANPTWHSIPLHLDLLCNPALRVYLKNSVWQVGSTDIIVLQKWLVLFLQNPWTPKQIAFWAKSKMTTEVGLEASLRTGTIYQKKTKFRG